MQETTHAISIKLQDMPSGKFASKVINEIALDFKTILDNEKSTLTILPKDVVDVRCKLVDAGFSIVDVTAVHLSQEDAWLLSDEDEFDDDLEIFLNNDIDLDFNDEDGVSPRF